MEPFDDVELEAIAPHQLKETYYKHVDTQVSPDAVNVWISWVTFGMALEMIALSSPLGNMQRLKLRATRMGVDFRRNWGSCWLLGIPQ